MSDLHVPARHSPLTRDTPFRPPLHPNAPEPESEYPGIWDWTPRNETPLQVRRPSGGPEGVPETQPHTNDLLNVALTVIAGLSLGIVVTTALRLILPND
jgi:hypothetical protein